MAIILRGDKGAPLTHVELDGNFETLDSDIGQTLLDGYEYTNSAVSGLLQGSTLQNYAETINDLGSQSGFVSIDLSLGNVVTVTSTAAITFDVTSLIMNKANSFTMILSGSNAVTWPSGTKWSNGVAPTLGAVNVIGFITVNNGTTWYGLPNTSMS